MIATEARARLSRAITDLEALALAMLKSTPETLADMPLPVHRAVERARDAFGQFMREQDGEAKQ